MKPWLKHYPEGIQEEISIEKMTLGELLDRAVEKYGERTALRFYEKKWSYRDVWKAAKCFAASLAASGVKKGDRVAIMLPNTPHYVFALFGTFQAGAIVTQVNPMYVEREIEHILNDSGAETMVVYAPLYARVNNVRFRTSLKKVVVVTLGDEDVALENGDIGFDDFLKTDTERTAQVDLDPVKDVAVLQYTGGTTGVSKGVMLTHQNIIANLEQTYHFNFSKLDFPADARSINILPMFHIYGLTCVTFTGFRAGIEQIILPRFDVNEVLETIRREKPFFFSGVPTMYIALNSVPNVSKYGLDSVRYYNSGGSGMPVEQLHAFEKNSGQYVYEGYGLSETSPVTHVNPPFLTRRPGSIGIPIPNTDARIVIPDDEGMKEADIGEIGELVISGPQVMKGYWGRPEETNAVLKDGWLHTGDMARMDEEGYFYIVDRKKDMIVASGYNVYPREVEEVIYEIPAVQETAVIGVPDPYRGETVKAFIVCKQGASLTEEDVMAHCDKRLAAYKRPKKIEFVTDLPKSAVGKLLRRVLRDKEVEKRESKNA